MSTSLKDVNLPPSMAHEAAGLDPAMRPPAYDRIVTAVQRSRLTIFGGLSETPHPTSGLQ